jgi:N-acetylneuraminate synthase/N,N'-diacetyllegionaminate synthase
MGSKGLPIILSTGMSTVDEVADSIDAIRSGGATDITLLHCTTNYPCPLDEVNLLAMDTLRKHFECPVGYSDHTKGIEASLAAVAMGAKVIEKHFTLDCSMDGPDHVASTEPKEFKEMVDSIRKVEKCLGSGVKAPTESEVSIKSVVTKRIVARCKIAEGDIFSESNLCVKRSDTGLKAREWDSVIGTKAKRYYTEDEGIDG